MNEERGKKLQDFNAKQQDLKKAAEMLCEMSDDHRSYITVMMNLLREIGRMTGVVDDNSNDSHNEGFTTVCSYISKITSNVNKVMEESKILEHEQQKCMTKVIELKKCLNKNRKENSLSILRMRLNMQLLKNVHQEEVVALKKEISEKENKLKEMQDEADKAAKIQKLKRMNEERAMSRKELEDLEDAVSKDIKTLQMRKLFVQDMHAKVKPVVPEDDRQREVIEKSLSTSMENMKSLKVEIGRIQKIVHQNSTRR